MKIRAFIAHAAWDPRRIEPRRRLERQLVEQDIPVLTLYSNEREHASTWARRLWREIAPSELDLAICLNDDVELHPRFAQRVTELARLLPGEFLALHPNTNEIAAAAAAGARLVRGYWPTGPAYALTPRDAAEALAWLAQPIAREWFADQVNEDGALASWLWSRQRPAYLTIPALVRHDATVPSTLGYDAHAGRTSPVDWATFPDRSWTTEDVAGAPYVECPWQRDAFFAALDDTLRGKRPLCAYCAKDPGTFVHPTTKRALCFRCAQSITSSVGHLCGPPGMRRG